MRKRTNYENYPEEIDFYLEKERKDYGSSGLKSLYEEDIDMDNYQRKKKYENLEIDKIDDKISYYYFDDNFIKKAKKIIKGDNKKLFLLNMIRNILYQQKEEHFQNEKFVCYKNFLYSLFVTRQKTNTGQLRINYGIFFEKTPRVKPFSTYIEKFIFFDLSEELNTSAPDNFNKIIYNFEQKYAEKNNDLEYDKMILLGDKNRRLLYREADSIYYIPFTFEIPTKNEIYKKINIFGTEYIQGFNMDIWDLKYPIDSVLNKINEENKFNYNGFFEKDVLKFHPSKIETKLINMNENFILSGRPGTGKTVIILIKVIMYFLKCLYEHSNIIKGEVDYNYINNNLITNSDIVANEDDKKENNETESDNYLIKIPIKKEDIKNKQLEIEINKIMEKEENNNLEEEKLGSDGHTYKIIFTSLSQSLCAFVENYFMEGIKNSNIPIQISPIKQKTYEKMSTFAFQKKYPLFLNFRKLLFMIDGSLNYPFFDRPNSNQLKKRQEDCDIRYYPDCEYDVMVDLSKFIRKWGNNYFYRRKYLSAPVVMTEINEDSFYNAYDESIKNNKILNNENNNISSYEVYSNIISIIKGSVKSYLGGCLSREEYYSLGKKICPFNSEQKKEIYNIFEKYEYWKRDNHYFDIQDLVNYLINEVNIELVPENRKLLDLVFIDEVQDFSINQLYLLFLITRDIKVMAGDTCQTISKINTFRFADLNNVLYTIGELKNIKIMEPRHIEINLNFRCHANILRLAHLVYEMIFYFFSNTLDKVRMDFSTQVGGGEKPYLIPYKINFKDKNENSQNYGKTGFDYFLKGLTENNLFLDDEKSIINASFSVNHCVICRNNNTVKNLNKKYNNKIFCSTVYECKGLEYEIVIIYNFFKDSLPFVQNIWKFILKNIHFNKVENNYLSLVKQNLEYENINQSIRDEIYTMFKQKVSVEFPQNINLQFSLFNFCSELKEFYVAISRAKSRLFIYEENMELLKLFIERINDLDIIVQDIFIKKIEDKKEKEIKNKNNLFLVENFGDTFNLLNKKIIGLLKFLEKSKATKENLSRTAYDEYNQDNEYNYKKAFYLFQVINDNIMKNKCLINLKYIEMQKIKGTKNEKLKEKYIQLNQEILELINKIDYDDERQIKGEVLLNLEKYDEALEYFISHNNYKKCGISLIKQKNFEKALEYFEKGKEFAFSVYCLTEMGEHQKLYSFLLKNKEQFDLEHIQYYYKVTCDKFFKKYAIPIKNFEKLIKKLNNPEKKNENEIKNSKNDEKNDENQKKIEIKTNIITFEDKININNKDKIIYIDKDNKLLSLLNEEKIKIKKPFITCSKTNYDVFDINITDKTNIYDINKSKEQIIYLINTFKDMINFMLVYLQIIISKTEKTKKQTIFIKKCKELLSYIETKMDIIEYYKEVEIDKILNIMENLIIEEHDNKVIILGILKNIEAKKYIYNLYDILVFKVKILDHITEDLPILKQHKNKNNKINKEILYKESIEQIVEYSKFLPLKESIIIKNIKSALILNGYYEGLLGITPNDDIISLLNLSITLGKLKLFELIIKKLDIDFIKGKAGNNNNTNIIITNNKIAYYMNNYICLLLSKFFNYLLSQPSKKNKINQILEKIKIFPKIYNILKFISDINQNNNENLMNYFDLIYDMEKYIEYCENIKLNINDNNYDNLINLIIIGSEISLIIYIYSNNNITINLDLLQDNHNHDILNKHIVIISKVQTILNIINKLEDKILSNNIPFNSLLNSFYIYSLWNDIVPSVPSTDKKEIINKQLYLKINKTNKEIVEYFKNYRIDVIIEKYFSNYIQKVYNLIKLNDNNKSLKEIYQYMFYIYDDIDIEEKNKYNLDKYFWNDEIKFNNIIKYLNEIPYDGEYSIDDKKNINYIEQSKIIFNKNKNIYENILNEIISEKQRLYNENKNHNNTSYKKLVEYILYSNLIGGYIKINYNNNNDITNNMKDDEFNKDFIDNYYFHKNFSYIHALTLINIYYKENINQLLVIIWLRKIYNCVYAYFYDTNKDKKNNYKLYKNQNSLQDKKLNIYNIKNILASNKNNNDNFIENYLDTLSLFIKDKKKISENMKSDIKIFFSEIYYSLDNLIENQNLIKNQILKRKIKLILDEMKKTDLLIENINIFKEVMIINDEKMKNDIIYEEIEKINIIIEDDKNESYEDEDDFYFDDIESSLNQKIENKHNYY